MIVNIDDYKIKEIVLEDSERMELRVEIFGPVAQFHFTPRKWSHTYVKQYRKVLDHYYGVFKRKGVDIVIEVFKPESEKRIRLCELLNMDYLIVPGLEQYVVLGKIL